MVEKRSNDDAWLSRPPRDAAVVLFFGSDRGLVSERARQFAAATGLPLDDAFSVVRLDGASIEAEPGRLDDEARTISMFAAERLIWIRNAANGKVLVEAVKRLAAEPPSGARILIEAGELKKGVGLRGCVATAKHAIGLPCYADDGRMLNLLIDQELEEAGLSMTLEARSRLREALGGDRLASRGELAKLVLYSRGMSEIGVEEVEAAVSDAAGLSADAAVDAVLAGRTLDADRLISRILAQGAQVHALLTAAMRQLSTLALLRRAMDAEGRTAQAAVASARPPVFFSRQKDVETALRRWDAVGIAAILSRLQSVLLEARRDPDLAEAATRNLLLRIAKDGEQRRPHR